MQVHIITPFFKLNNAREINFGIKRPINQNAIKTLEDDTVQFSRKNTHKQRENWIREQKIVDMINKGYKQEEIARILNIHLSLVNASAKKYDAFQKRISKRNEEIIAKLIQGANRKELASEYGLSIRTINELAEENDAFKRYVEQRDKKIMELLKEGYLAIEIAEMLGISDSTVSRTAHKNGLMLKKKKSILKK